MTIAAYFFCCRLIGFISDDVVGYQPLGNGSVVFPRRLLLKR